MITASYTYPALSIQQRDLGVQQLRQLTVRLQLADVLQDVVHALFLTQPLELLGGGVALARVVDGRRDGSAEVLRRHAVGLHHPRRAHQAVVRTQLAHRVPGVALDVVHYPIVLELTLGALRELQLFVQRIAVLARERRGRLAVHAVQDLEYALVVRGVRDVLVAQQRAQIGDRPVRGVVGVELPLQEARDLLHLLQAHDIRQLAHHAGVVHRQLPEVLNVDGQRVLFQLGLLGLDGAAHYDRLGHAHVLVEKLTVLFADARLDALAQYPGGLLPVLAGDAVQRSAAGPGIPGSCRLRH